MTRNGMKKRKRIKVTITLMTRNLVLGSGRLRRWWSSHCCAIFKINISLGHSCRDWNFYANFFVCHWCGRIKCAELIQGHILFGHLSNTLETAAVGVVDQINVMNGLSLAFSMRHIDIERGITKSPRNRCVVVCRYYYRYAPYPILSCCCWSCELGNVTMTVEMEYRFAAGS